MKEKRKIIVGVFNRYEENKKIDNIYGSSNIVKESNNSSFDSHSKILSSEILSNGNAIREIAVAEILLSRLDKYERDLVKRKYIDKVKAYSVADEFYTSKSTLYRKLEVAFEKMYVEYDKLVSTYPNLFD